MIIKNNLLTKEFLDYTDEELINVFKFVLLTFDQGLMMPRSEWKPTRLREYNGHALLRGVIKPQFFFSMSRRRRKKYIAFNGAEPKEYGYEMLTAKNYDIVRKACKAAELMITFFRIETGASKQETKDSIEEAFTDRDFLARVLLLMRYKWRD